MSKFISMYKGSIGATIVLITMFMLVAPIFIEIKKDTLPTYNGNLTILVGMCTMVLQEYFRRAAKESSEAKKTSIYGK